MKNKTTSERIEEILKELVSLNQNDKIVIKLQLEALVIQAQLEQLQNKNETK